MLLTIRMKAGYFPEWQGWIIRLMIERIEHNNILFAIVIRGDFGEEGVNFVTPKENPLQLGVIQHEKGTIIKPHIHKNVKKTIEQVQEVLYIVYGKIRAEFFNDEGTSLGDVILNQGDTILLIEGGHGFNMLENTKIIEVKQGPYYNVEQDKQRLNE